MLRAIYNKHGFYTSCANPTKKQEAHTLLLVKIKNLAFILVVIIPPEKQEAHTLYWFGELPIPINKRL
jgi:hypothetical protein